MKTRLAFAVAFLFTVVASAYHSVAGSQNQALAAIGTSHSGYYCCGGDPHPPKPKPKPDIKPADIQ